MTKEEIITMLGELPSSVEIDDLVAASNADPDEGVEWLPRYKMAISLLTQIVVSLAGAASQLAVALKATPSGMTLQLILDSCSKEYNTAMKCLADNVAEEHMWKTGE